MEKKHRLILFSFEKGFPEDGQEWLQITSINNIAVLDREIKQKIIRLNEQDQKELYAFLSSKFSKGKVE